MIDYKINHKITPWQFIDVLERSTLGQRRPVKDLPRITTMLNNANILLTAWEGEKLIGVFRGVTDYAYCCYLSDLAVDADHQSQGIGKALVNLAHEHLGDGVSIFLLAAPGSISFYRHLGLKHVENGYVLQRAR